MRNAERNNPTRRRREPPRSSKSLDKLTNDQQNYQPPAAAFHLWHEHTDQPGTRGTRVVWVGGDEGVTGRDITQRKGLLLLLAAGKAGYLDYIATNDVSRFARRLYQAMMLLSIMQEWNLGLITNGRIYDPSNIADFFQLGVESGMSEFEWGKIRERLQTGREVATKRGIWLGGKAPFGYRCKPEGGLEIDDYEAEIVRKILVEYKNESYREISRRLNESGFRSRNGSPFIESLVRTIVHGRKPSEVALRPRPLFYAGKGKDYQGNIVDAEWPAIINEDELIEFETIMKKRFVSKAEGGKNFFLLTKLGILRCGSCGYAFTSRSRQKSKGSNRYTRRYQCSRFQALKDCENNEPINAFVFEHLITQMAKDEAEAIIRDADFPEVEDEDAFNYDRLLEEIKRKKERLVIKVENVDDSQLFIDRINQLTTQEDEVKREKEWAQRRTQMVTTDKEVIRRILANLLETAERPEELRALILSTIKNIKVFPQNVEVTFHSGRKLAIDIKAYC